MESYGIGDVGRIVGAVLVSEGELCVVVEDGTVGVLDYRIGRLEVIYRIVEFEVGAMAVEVYAYEGYVSVVQDRGTMGVVLDRRDGRKVVDLVRGNYQVRHCAWPIAFYRDGADVLLVHGVDWNRLEVTDLGTGKRVTARGEGVEDLDYFVGELLVSPSGRYFTSNGWVWGPADLILYWEVGAFMEGFERGFRNIAYPGGTDGYNWGRPLCWVDEGTVAYAYSLSEEEGEDGERPEVAQELVLVRIAEGEIVRRIPFEGFVIGEYQEIRPGKLYYHVGRRCYVSLHEKRGMAIGDMDGRVLLRDERAWVYAPGLGLLWRVGDGVVEIGRF